MQSFKQTLNFRLNLAQARTESILQVEGSNADLIALEENYKSEIQALSILVEQNPQLALEHAKVKDLEGKLV